MVSLSAFEQLVEVGSRCDLHLYEGQAPRGIASRNFGPTEVPQDKLFMMGDNRDNSRDSRVLGFVDWQKNAKGKAIFIYWSWDGKKKFPRFDRIGDLIH